MVIDSGCQTVPLIGTVSHVELGSAQARDTILSETEDGGLIVIVQWSSDSLASGSRPVGAQLVLFNHDTSTRIVRIVDSSGVVDVVVPTPGQFRLQVRRMLAWRVDTSFMVRQGYKDTARVYLQYGGGQFCS